MKKRFTIIICIVFVLVILTACNRIIVTPKDTKPNTDSVVTGSVDSSSVALGYQKITSADGKKLLDNGVILTLVDVRRADEYEAAHIPGAVNVPNESISDTQPAELPDLNKTVVVYCRTGIRSKQAADKLIEMGYTDVRDMGGIVDWTYDTVSGTEPGEYPAVISETVAASSGLMGNFKAEDLNGNNINQSIFTGYDLTMVNVWATYCGPCLSEMPDLGELADEYESKGVRIVGMVTDVLKSDGTVSSSQIDTARRIIKTTGADYTHIIPSEDLFGLLSQITAVPTTFFVDSTGTQVGSAYLGSKSKTEWSDIITQMLKETQK